MKRITPKGMWEVLKNSFNGFLDDKVLKLSASLAYYTVFSLAPLLIVLLFICGKVFGQEAIEGSIYGQIKGFVGPESYV
jgi:membrane protein